MADDEWEARMAAAPTEEESDDDMPSGAAAAEGSPSKSVASEEGSPAKPGVRKDKSLYGDDATREGLEEYIALLRENPRAATPGRRRKKHELEAEAAAGGAKNSALQAIADRHKLVTELERKAAAAGVGDTHKVGGGECDTSMGTSDGTFLLARPVGVQVQ